MSDRPTLPGFETAAETVNHAPARHAGLARLDQFVPRAGRHYATRRNYDFGPDRRDNVSALSPWLRHRLVTEEEVLRATLARHSFSSAEKFVQEVFWRSYLKGWLEQHPSVWAAYLAGLAVEFWPNLESLKSQWQVDRSFTPQMDSTKAKDYLKTWHKAVSRAADWIE